MTAPAQLSLAGERIAQLLEQLEAAGERQTLELAEEVLRVMSDLYGAGLARIVELARQEAPPFLEAMAADELVASLLIVHGLHPVPLGERVQAALARVRPLLGAHGGDVELIGVDPDLPGVAIRLLGSCDGCPAASLTLHDAVERAILEAAPEVARIDVEEPHPLGSEEAVHLSRRASPAFEACPAGTTSG